MAVFQWIPDIPAGVLRNHALSQALRRVSLAEAKFMAFVKPEPGYGRKKGDTLTVTRRKAVAEPTSAKLSETSKIPVDTFSLSTRAVTVSEWGRALEYTNLAEELTWFNLESELQAALKEQMKLVMDTAAAAAFKACKIKYIPTSLVAGVFDTDGTPSTQATENATIAHIAEIRDYLKSTLFASPWAGGDDYVCLASTKFLRGIKNDPDWEEWNKYTDPKKKFNSEVGRIENTRFVEVNHSNALSGSKGLNNVLGEAVVFGADAVGMAVVEDPELRVGIGQDFGRQKAVAWYGILEFFDVWDTANAGEAKIIHITSS